MLSFTSNYQTNESGDNLRGESLESTKKIIHPILEIREQEIFSNFRCSEVVFHCVILQTNWPIIAL